LDSADAVADGAGGVAVIGSAVVLGVGTGVVTAAALPFAVGAVGAGCAIAVASKAYKGFVRIFG